MRLCGPRALAGNVACGRGALFDRPDRLTRHAVEHIGVALLGELHERFHGTAVDRHVHQRRSGREIVVPDVVVRDLVVPDAPSGLEVDGDNRIGEQIAAEAVTAIVIVGRRFDGQIGVAELGIDRDRRPHAGVAGVGVGVLLPCLRAGLAVLRHRVERPFLFSGARVERHHVAGRVAHRARHEPFFERGRTMTVSR